MTLAAIDRLVRHSTILDMNVERFRRRAAFDLKRGPGRPPMRRDNQGEQLVAAPRGHSAAQEKPLATLQHCDDHNIAPG
jgi:hypothetical protein